jgi:hypothetical protein
MEPLKPRTFAQYRADHAVMTPAHVAPLVMDLSIPAVRAAHASQQGSTWPTIPWNAPTSWGGWMQLPNGIEYRPAIIVSSEPPAYSRYAWDDLPVNGRFRDAGWLIPAAISNGIATHSTFASTEHVSAREQARVMVGFRRIIKAVTGVRL